MDLPETDSPLATCVCVPLIPKADTAPTESASADFIRLMIRHVIRQHTGACVCKTEATSLNTYVVRCFSTVPMTYERWTECVRRAAEKSGVDTNEATWAFSNDRWPVAST